MTPELTIGHSSAVRLRDYLSLSARDDAGFNKWDTQTAFALAVRLVDDLPRINLLKELWATQTPFGLYIVTETILQSTLRKISRCILATQTAFVLLS